MSSPIFDVKSTDLLDSVVARHSIERKTAKLFATEVAKWFGFKGSLGTDLHLLRIQEEEADRMGLMISKY